MSRHPNECWDCGQVPPDKHPKPEFYHAMVEADRQRAECHSKVREAAARLWSDYTDTWSQGFCQDMVDDFRELYRWIAPDMLPELEYDVATEKSYREWKKEHPQDVQGS